MPNTSQAQKRVRQNAKTNLIKSSQRSEMRTLIKQLISFINKKELEQAKEYFKKLSKRLQQLASKKVIKKNKAARITSRLNKKLKDLASA